jgi:hypothetical protein
MIPPYFGLMPPLSFATSSSSESVGDSPLKKMFEKARTRPNEESVCIFFEDADFKNYHNYNLICNKKKGAAGAKISCKPT